MCKSILQELPLRLGSAMIGCHRKELIALNESKVSMVTIKYGFTSRSSKLIIESGTQICVVHNFNYCEILLLQARVYSRAGGPLSWLRHHHLAGGVNYGCEAWRITRQLRNAKMASCRITGGGEFGGRRQRCLEMVTSCRAAVAREDPYRCAARTFSSHTQSHLPFCGKLPSPEKIWTNSPGYENVISKRTIIPAGDWKTARICGAGWRLV